MIGDALVAPLFAYGLPGTAWALPAGALEPGRFDRLVDAAAKAGAQGHLLAAIDDGAVEAPDGGRQAVVDRLLDRCEAELRIERALVEAVDALCAVGVDVRVLKGPAAAHLDYDRPWRRRFADVDLLVRSDDFDIACGALLAAGLWRRHAELRPGFDRRFTKAACLVRGDGIEVDLHRTFTMGPFGLTVALDDLWAHRDSFTVGGTEVGALCREHRLLHACYHAILGNAVPGRTPLRDIAGIATSPLDLELLAAATAAWRSEALVAAAVEAAWRWLRLDPDHPVARWAATLSVPEAQRRAIRAYDTGKGERFASTSIAAVRWLPWRDRVRFVAALAFPTHAYLATSGRTHRARVGRAVRAVIDRAR